MICMSMGANAVEMATQADDAKRAVVELAAALARLVDDIPAEVEMVVRY